MTEDRELKEILHNLEHQKAEAIGVEKLATDAVQLMTGILLIERLMHMNGPQRAAVYAVLGKWEREYICPKCVELSVRIENQLDRDFKEFVSRKEEEHET